MHYISYIGRTMWPRFVATIILFASLLVNIMLT